MLNYPNQLAGWGVGYTFITEEYLDSTGLFEDTSVSILATIAKQERGRFSESSKTGMVRKVAAGVKMDPPTKSREQIK